MDSVMQAVFAQILTKLERIENVLINVGMMQNPIKSQENSKRYATVRQMTYVKKLGGDTWEGMTHEEASKQIESLKPSAGDQSGDIETQDPEELMGDCFL